MTKILSNNAKHDDFELDAEFLILTSPQEKGDENEHQRIYAIYQVQRQDKEKLKGKFQVDETGV